MSAKKPREAEKGSIRVTLSFNVYADEGFTNMSCATPAQVQEAIQFLAQCVLRERDGSTRAGGWDRGNWGFKWQRLMKEGKVKP